MTVKAVYKSDKRLSKYTITVKDQNGTEFMNKTYSATPEVDGSDCCIPNTAFQSLPATGGVGTLVFTLAGGIMIMAGTVVLLRIKKRPEA